MEHIFYVYHLIDSTTGTTFYVGKGHGNRMYEHVKEVERGKVPHNKHLYYKIRKILMSGGCVEYKKVLDGLDKNTSLIEESNEITKLGRADLGLGMLCNLTNGGEGSGGYKWSETQKQIKKIQNRGIGNPMYGKTHTTNAKQKMSWKRNLRTKKFRHSITHRTHLRLDNAGGKATSKPIFQLDLNNEIVGCWPSLSSAARAIGVSKTNIFSSIKNGWKSGNYRWKYA